ncbi:MAG: DinB family protein [Gemmatimonadetes bacterium]|nr:DinB family protein [Gemmatimonadota bacterium]MBK6843930.1 DinB family protein [Gemmatimonadota bacterium]MBK9411414.1 DinB family protein [Gemmatimonadota bacterium]MBK9976974.1 DinB family protein [Gemmatimonadota bacterium]MBP9105509.1 DinB family protein [Gemmatimonadaceae bacterium]
MDTRVFVLAAALAVAAPVALRAQAAPTAPSWMGEMHRDVNGAQKKMIDLAKAIPEAAYDWRPSAGTRSVREVFLHVASDNYFIPIGMGKPAPEASGITSDMKSVGAYEKRNLSKEQIVAELEASYKHLHQGMALTTDANASESIKFFGQDWTRMRAMTLTVTHLHEHLGQAIAYARSNNVVPPWSQ